MRRFRSKDRGFGVVADAQLARAQTWIARPALEGRINVALDEGSLLLIAGAGYGKTLVLDAALRARGTRCAWVHCDEAYGDAGRLVRGLVSAVDQGGAGHGAGSQRANWSRPRSGSM